MLLKVEEIRLERPEFAETARRQAAGISAWAASVGIMPYQLMLDQEWGKAPYVEVPERYFQDPVLPHLQALTPGEQLVITI